MLSMLSNAIREAKKIEVTNAYTAEDGSIRCRTCGKKKVGTYSIPELNKTFTVPVLCDCEAAIRDGKVAQINASVSISNKEENKRVVGIRENYDSCKFAKDDDPKGTISTMVRGYVNKFGNNNSKRKGLLLYGDVGTGKTFYAGCIYNALKYNGKDAIMTSLPTLIQAMTIDFGKNRDACLSMVMDAELLVIDDFGIERHNPASMEAMFEIINIRSMSGKPLVITTNIPLREMENETDVNLKRLYDRILGMCFPIQFVGESKRVKEA